MTAWETIITPPETVLLLTPAEVRAELGIPDGDDNSVIYADIRAVSAKIDAYLHRNLARATVSVAFDEDPYSDYLRLSRYPVVSVTSVTEDGTALATTDFKIDQATGFLYRRCNGRPARWPFAGVTVVYVGGYWLPEQDSYDEADPASLPADIHQAALIACRAIYQSRGRDPMVKSETVPGVIEQEYWVGTDPGQGESGLPAESERLLDPHRSQALY